MGKNKEYFSFSTKNRYKKMSVKFANWTGVNTNLRIRDERFDRISAEQDEFNEIRIAMLRRLEKK